jgi:AcrR family transcriptional regulator
MFNSGLTPKGEETRRRVYEAAMGLFRERGFDATTMRDVAGAAGMSLGAAYHYFPGKDAIVLAYYESVQERHALGVVRACRTTPGLRERLAMAMHSKLHIVRADRPLLGALLRFTGQPDHPLSFLGAGTRGIQQRSMAVFAEPLEGADLPPDLRPLAPLLLWALHMGLLLYFLYDTSPEQRRTHRLADGAIDLFLAAMKLARLPVFRPFRTRVAALLGDAGLVPDAAAIERHRLDLVAAARDA